MTTIDMLKAAIGKLLTDSHEADRLTYEERVGYDNALYEVLEVLDDMEQTE